MGWHRPEGLGDIEGEGGGGPGGGGGPPGSGGVGGHGAGAGGGLGPGGSLLTGLGSGCGCWAVPSGRRRCQLGVDWYYRATAAARVIEGGDLLYGFQLFPSLPEVSSH